MIARKISFLCIPIICGLHPLIALAQVDVGINFWSSYGMNEVGISFHAYCSGTNYWFLDSSNVTVYDDSTRITEFTFSPLFGRVPSSCVMLFDGKIGRGASSYLEFTKARAREYIDVMSEYDDLMILSIDSVISTNAFMSYDKEYLLDKLNTIQGYSGSTRLFDGILQAIKENLNWGNRRSLSIIVFTNGEDGGSLTTPQEIIDFVRYRYPLRIFPIGAGDTLNSGVLQSLGSYTGGRFYPQATKIEMIDICVGLGVGPPGYYDTYHQLVYKTPCADGKTHKVTVKIDSLPDCPGSNSTTRSFRALFDSANVIQLNVDEISSSRNAGITLPITLYRSLKHSIDSSAMLVQFDTSCVKFIGVETNETLFQGNQLRWSYVDQGIVIFLPPFVQVDSAGVLVKLNFQTRSYSIETECGIRVLDWSIDPPCSQKKLIPGRITTIGVTSVQSSSSPTVFELHQNSPNPFSESTTIKLPLLSAERRGEVSLKVFDLFGREVLDLSDEARNNSHVTILKSQLPGAGIYFYRLTVGNQIRSKMMHRL